MDAIAVEPRVDRTESTTSRSGALRTELVGRGAELEAIEHFLTDGSAQALVIEGGAGIGKSTVLSGGVEIARERAWRVLEARPAVVELPLSFAGLRDLLEGVPCEVRHRLPDVQEHALAFALAEVEMGTSPIDSGVVGVALLGVLRELAAERPLVLAIDDWQWLDDESGEVIVYAVRRLGRSRVQLLTSCRGEPGWPLPFALERVLAETSLIRVALGPLSEGAIRRIVRLRLGVSLSRTQLHAVYEAGGGNPFYSLELVRSGLEVDEWGSLHLPRNLHELAGARVERLPAGTRDALLFVAAVTDPTLDVLARCGVHEVLRPALAADIVEVDGDRIRFAHPLIKAAAWSAGGERRQREVHRRLAEVVECSEQRARHLGGAAEAPDAEAAIVLEQAAATARRRGAAAAAADLLDRALELTPADEIDLWARLAAQAATAHAEASHWDSVSELIGRAEARVPAGPERAAILLASTEMRPGLEELLQQAAGEAGETAVGVRARIGLTEQACLAGRWHEGAEAAQEAVTLARSLGDRGLLGTALTSLCGAKLLDSRLDGRQELVEALTIQREVGELCGTVFESPQSWHAFALTFGPDPGAARPILEKRWATAAERGDDTSAFVWLRYRLVAELFADDWGAARTTARAALDCAEVLGYEYGHHRLLGSLAFLAAYEGDLEQARALGTEALAGLTALGDRFSSIHALAALVFTELCAGNAAAALAHVRAIDDRTAGRECWWSYHQGDEIESLVLAGAHERARERLQALRRAGHEYELPRFLAWACRGEGLVRAMEVDLAAAHDALESALAHHERFVSPFERARTMLVYGHVLRRQLKRREARAALRESLAVFERLGARHFVDVVQDELKHVGGRPPAREHELTGTEDRIARLVAGGLSNKDVAAELCVAVSTVEAALTRVYRKLGVHSRSQLAGLLPRRDDG